MKKIILLIVFALCLFVCDTSNELFAQGATCAEATQLCDDVACGSYEIGSGQADDPIASESSSCLGSDPNSTWFFLIDNQGGGGTINISNTPACDTDFAAWGPFDTPADALAACNGGISTANEVGCNYLTVPGGDINMPASSQVGDVYLMVITNFSDDPGIDVVVTSPPLICCPVATGVKADIDVCSGSTVPVVSLADFEGLPAEVSSNNLFITDLGLSTSPTALVTPTPADFVNNTCDPIDVELYYLYECDRDCDGIGDEATAAGSFIATVYPDATTFVVTETPGACGTAAMVSIATAGGTVCYSEAGNVPMDPGCGNPDDVQDLSYSYDPGFSAACNMMFTGTIAAQCAAAACGGCADPCFVEYDPAVVAPGDPADCITPVGMTACDDNNPCTVNDMEVLGGDGVACVPCAGTPVDCATPGEATSQACDDGDPCTINDVEVILLCDGSICTPCAGTVVTPPIPALTCPPAELDFCSGTYDCMFLDSNVDTDGNGVTDAPIITGSAASATDAAGVIDLTQLTPGATYTITLNYEEAGCFGTPVTCTFTVTVPNDAEGGQF